ncbi:oxidoreductase [bacterium]|nr:oxidoreductase [bacterium]
MSILTFADYNEALEEQWWARVAQLISNEGFVVVDDFLNSETARLLRNEIDAKDAENELRRAGIGKDFQFQKNLSQRGDFIAWIEKQEVSNETELFINRMETAMKLLNRNLFLGLKDFETHFTHYPPGTFYKRHADRFHENAHRVLSFVCYLNQGWLPEDGGQLLVYNNDETTVVEPIEGRLIIFQSQLEHEVLLTTKSRYSITGWMLDQLEGLTFL